MAMSVLAFALFLLFTTASTLRTSNFSVVYVQNREPGEKTKIKDQAQRDAPVLLAEKRNPTVSVIAENLSWLENLALDPATNSLFMSELKLGRVWRVNGSYHKEIWLSNFTEILGLTINPNKPGVLYGVGKRRGANVVFRTSTTTPETCVTITQLPKGKLGNGFGVHHESGFLYASSEGNFLPDGGSLFSIDPNTGNVTTISNRLWGADGLWIDQQRHLLYVGQVTNSKMLVWHLTLSNHSNPATSLGSMSTDGLGALAFMDDFTLGRNGSSIVAASWRKSEILEFPAYRTNKSFPLTVLVGGNSSIVHPTSARWGESLDPKSSFPSSALFATEGHAKDYLNPFKDHTSRLLRIDFPPAEE